MKQSFLMFNCKCMVVNNPLPTTALIPMEKVIVERAFFYCWEDRLEHVGSLERLGRLPMTPTHISLPKTLHIIPHHICLCCLP